MEYVVMDVFSANAGEGNPVAVVFDAGGLSSARMEAIARWFNLSETTFVTSVDQGAGAYEVRIFTPTGELPFAGHPTLGTAAAVRHRHGFTGEFMLQHCEAGEVPVRFAADGHAAFSAPRATVVAELETRRADVANALRTDAAILDAASIDTGPVWGTVLLEHGEAVASLQPDLTALAALSTAMGVVGFTIAGSLEGDRLFKVRTFAPAEGVPEDPVCGSGNVAVAKLLRRTHAAATAYEVRQGQEVGRDGRVFVRYLEEGGIEVGGATHLTAQGRLLGF